jgi:hypothetical protein
MSEMGPESGSESSAPAAESSGSEAGEGRPAEGGDAPGTERAGGEGADAEGIESSAEGGAGTSSRAEPGENGPAHAEATDIESTTDDGGDSTTGGVEGGESGAEDDAGPADQTEPGENGPAQAEGPEAEDASEEGAPKEGELDESTEPDEPPEPDEPTDDAADLEAVQPDLAEPTALEEPETAGLEPSEPDEAEVPETEGSGSGEIDGAGSTDPEAINPEGSDANLKGSDAEEPDSEQSEDVESATSESDEDSDEMPEAEDEDSKQPEQTEEPEEPAPVTAGGGSDDDAGSDDDGAGSAVGESGTKTEQPPTATTDQAVDQVLGRVNPNYEEKTSAYSENCTGVVQANELQRRGFDVQAGPLEPGLRSDQGGPGGRSLSTIEQTWGRDFTPGTKPEIEAAFQEPASRGVVYIRWDTGGGHVFNVENVGGTVRFVDGQTIPPVTDASGYFDRGGQTRYLRLDDLPTPPSSATAKYVQPRSR